MPVWNSLAAGFQSLRAKVAAAVKGADARKAAQPTYQPTPDEQLVLKLLEEPKRVREATLVQFQPQWERNILYVAGMQYLQYINAARTFRKKQVHEWLPQPVENLIQPKVQAMVDFFTRNRPEGQVVPKSTHEDDIRGAELAEKVREHLWDVTEGDDTFDEHANSLVVLGNTIARLWIRNDRRSALRIPKYTEASEPILDEMGQPIINEQTGQPVTSRRVIEERDAEGNIVYDEVNQGGELAHTVVMPMAFTVPPPHRGPMNRTPWTLECGLYSLAELRELYPAFADFIPARGGALTSDLHHQRLSSIFAQSYGSVIRTMEPYVLEGYGVVFFYEQAPDRDFPNGLFLVEYAGLPLEIAELPLRNEPSYEHCGYNRVLGQFWHRGPVDDMIGPQDGNNRLEQSLEVNDAKHGHPVWLKHEESKIAEGALSGKPGLNVTWKGPAWAKPERLPPAPLSPEVITRKEGYRQTIEETSGYRNVLSGKAPPGITAGVALNMLGEDAERTFTPVTKRWDRFVERVETKKLQFVQAFYTEPRLLLITNEDSQPEEIADFRGADLRGNTRFKVQSGSYKPRSTAAQQSIILELLKTGLLESVVQDPGQLQEILDMLGLGKFKVRESADYRKARYENELLQRSVGWERVQRSPADDDLIHVQVHGEPEKEPEWDRLPNVVKMRHVQHVISHLEAIAAKGEGSGSLKPGAPDQGEDEPAVPAAPEPGKPGLRAIAGGGGAR